jgi:hypothetical protein
MEGAEVGARRIYEDGGCTEVDGGRAEADGALLKEILRCGSLCEDWATALETLRQGWAARLWVMIILVRSVSFPLSSFKFPGCLR